MFFFWAFFLFFFASFLNFHVFCRFFAKKLPTFLGGKLSEPTETPQAGSTGEDASLCRREALVVDTKVEGNEGFPLELPRNGPAAGIRKHLLGFR